MLACGRGLWRMARWVQMHFSVPKRRLRKIRSGKRAARSPLRAVALGAGPQTQKYHHPTNHFASFGNPLYIWGQQKKRTYQRVDGQGGRDHGARNRFLHLYQKTVFFRWSVKKLCRCAACASAKTTAPLETNRKKDKKHLSIATYSCVENVVSQGVPEKAICKTNLSFLAPSHKTSKKNLSDNHFTVVRGRACVPFVRIPSLALGLITCCVRPNALADISTTQSAATANPAGEREIARKTTQTTNPTHTEKNRRIGKKLLFCAPPNRKTSSFALLFTLLAKVGCENTHPHRCAASHALCWQRKSCVFPFRRRDLSSRLTEAWFSKTLSSENTFNFLNGLTSRMFHHREKRGHQKKNHKILYSFGKRAA